MTNHKKTVPQTAAELRGQAEESLVEREASHPRPRNGEDAQRALHELEVHQVELEIQNEELRQAWADVDSARERYADLYDLAPVGYFLLDRGGSILELNLEAATLLGGFRENLLHRALMPFLDLEDRPAFTAFLLSVHTSTTKHTREFRLHREDQTIHVLIEAMSARSADDAETGESGLGCRMAMIDISDRRAAEESLRQSEAIYRALVDDIDIGIALIDCDHNIVRANAAQAKFLGKRPEDFVGKKCFFAFEHRDQICDHCPGSKAMASRQTAEIESVGVREDGSCFVARIRACPWLGPDGRIQGFIEIIEDITERRRIEKQIEEFATVIAAKNEALEERTMAMEAATRAKDDFLASMSHELRTPLNAIIGFSEGLLERVHRHPLNDHQQSRIRAIRNSGEHLLMLVNGMLDLAKMESGKVQLNVMSFDLGAVANEIRETADALLKDRPEVRFTLKIQKHLPMVTSDRDKVRQILNNLVSNAVKFTKKGSIALEIRREGTSFVMKVQDTGTGIPEKYVDRVFEKFFQVPSVSERALKGSGLGLAISKAYAELLGGTMTLQSVEGKGTSFTVELPLSPGNGYHPEVRNVQEVTRAMRDSPRPDGLHAKILCVEPNEASMLLLSDSLTEAGYQVVPTSKGAEVIPLAIDEQPQLIVLDLVLQDTDGWQILHGLKMEPATCRIPVVVATSLDEERLALSLGADSYLRKPVDRVRLLNAIRQLLPSANQGAPPLTPGEKSMAVDRSTSGVPA